MNHLSNSCSRKLYMNVWNLMNFQFYEGGVCLWWSVVNFHGSPVECITKIQVSPLSILKEHPTDISFGLLSLKKKTPVHPFLPQTMLPTHSYPLKKPGPPLPIQNNSCLPLLTTDIPLLIKLLIYSWVALEPICLAWFIICFIRSILACLKAIEMRCPDCVIF